MVLTECCKTALNNYCNWELLILWMMICILFKPSVPQRVPPLELDHCFEHHPQFASSFSGKVEQSHYPHCLHRQCLVQLTHSSGWKPWSTYCETIEPWNRTIILGYRKCVHVKLGTSIGAALAGSLDDICNFFLMELLVCNVGNMIWGWSTYTWY
jgi:hypothetical protein